MRCGRRSGFLGRSRPSLIEADMRREFQTQFEAPFWGVRAPASLKQADEGILAAIPVAFWGVRAPASLKRHLYNSCGDMIHPFLGRSRPSLIEAIRVVNAASRVSQLSGAFAPQPH